MAVSVIIPAVDEEEWIAGAITSARDAGASEVIVADGGSSDRTARFATAGGARVVLSPPPRARQLNLGAGAASGEFLIFLHADSRLPAGAADAVERSGVAFGGFRLRFAEAGRKLRFAATMINARSAITREPWGDQAQFIARSAFRGFREIPIMEDYELARRMRRAGSTRILPLYVTTSGRRFLKNGLVRTALTNWSIVLRYHLGEDPERLAARYRGSPLL